MRTTAVFIIAAAASAHSLRVPPLRMCGPPAARQSGGLVVSQELLARVKSDLWRTGETDESKLQTEQREVISTLLPQIEELVAAGGGQPAVPPTDALDTVVAPHLPLLLGRSFVSSVRSALMQIRTEGEKAALLSLSQYVMGVQAEIADALSDLQLRQIQKLRELCDAAQDGGTERCLEMAEAMKEDLDTDFCNYLNYAIEQEEMRLRALEIEPFVPPPSIYGASAAASDVLEEEREAQAALQAQADKRALGAAEAGGSKGLSAAGGAGGGGGSGGWQRVQMGGGASAAANSEEEDDDDLVPFDSVGGSNTDGGGSSATPTAGKWRTVIEDDPAIARPRGAPPAVSAAKMAKYGPVGGAAEEEDSGVTSSAADAGDASTTAGGEAKQLATTTDGDEASAGGALSADGARGADGGKERAAEEQQWLLVLRLVRRGVYAMLAKEYTDDVKHIRYIIGLASSEAREELTRQTLMGMTAEAQSHFVTTLGRIGDNLSVQRDARDLEIYTKVREIQRHVETYRVDFGDAPDVAVGDAAKRPTRGVGGEYATM